MTHNRKPHMTVLRLAAVLLILVMLSTSMVCGRYARYVSSDNMEESARIAAFVFDVSDTSGHVVDLSKICKPGDTQTYQFVVSNHNGITSEVEEEYYLTLELRGSLPLVCVLTGADERRLDGKDVDTNVVSGAVHTFSASVATEKLYTLTVTWPGNEKNVAYSQAGLAELVLTIVAQQVD